jgi:hypothetical protein
MGIFFSGIPFRDYIFPLIFVRDVRMDQLKHAYFLLIITSETSIFFGRAYIWKMNCAISSADMNHPPIPFPVISAISDLRRSFPAVSIPPG